MKTKLNQISKEKKTVAKKTVKMIDVLKTSSAIVECVNFFQQHKASSQNKTSIIQKLQETIEIRRQMLLDENVDRCKIFPFFFVDTDYVRLEFPDLITYKLRHSYTMLYFSNVDTS